jgi:EAL domain-containing protein (putative c-di-GMP-specific phosphodiesterase class I)/FixJ family two-component response regulator
MTAPVLLVVDDEPMISTLVARVGRSLGFETVALNESQQIRGALEHAPSVIILDLSMPGFDGVEVLRLLAECRSDAAIILMSGFDRRVLVSTSRLAAQLGLTVGGILEKPLRLQALKDLLQTQRRKSRQSGAAPAPVPLDELRNALARHELVLHYQPQVDLNTRRWLGVEALVRWRHPERGMLFPNSFVAMAEQNGLALALTDEVIDVALREFNPRHFGLVHDLSLAINLPPAALVDRGFPEQVLRRVDAAGRAARGIHFEVTETSVAENPSLALDILTRLRLKGFGLSLDDFGTGHASMEILNDLPFDELKIDLQFVRTSDQDPSARSIAASSATLGRDLGLTVVAEGIENAAVLDLMARLGADVGQGYFIGRPMPWAALGDWAQGWLASS